MDAFIIEDGFTNYGQILAFHYNMHLVGESMLHCETESEWFWGHCCLRMVTAVLVTSDLSLSMPSHRFSSGSQLTPLSRALQLCKVSHFWIKLFYSWFNVFYVLINILIRELGLTTVS